MNNFILIGFDRSGTSAISRTLAMHPQVELVFRPFNSGPIRKKMYRIIDDSETTEKDRDFFNKLENQILDSSYFVSQWHEKFSTVKDAFEKDKLHIIITNINHFSVRWVKVNFPLIEQWAIWRDPIEILNSCIKNEFYGEWYTDALFEVIETVKKEEELFQLFGQYADLVLNSNYVLKTAYLIAVRNYFLFRNIEPEKIIDYEVFRNNPNVALTHVLSYFDLSHDFDFSYLLNEDLNSIPSVDGYSPRKKSEIIISNEDKETVDMLFEPLYKLYQPLKP